jgi:exodeoxyribonuclease X
MKIIFFDTETTGNGERDRLVQMAIKERGTAAPVLNALYKPPVPISIDSMAIHHITEKMVAERPQFVEAIEYKGMKDLFEHENTISVAHNAAFDVAMLAREDITPFRTICTLKIARALDTKETIGTYRLQYLRYKLGLEVDAVAHDAWGDVLVLEALFERLLEKMVKEEGSEEAALAKMIELSERQQLFTTLRFGKHKGKRIEDLARTERSYLQWLLGEKEKEPFGEADWIHTLKHYLSDNKV